MSESYTRRYRRMNLDLPARVTINAIDDYDGIARTLSPGDLSVDIAGPVLPGDAAIVAVQGIDIFETRIVRLTDTGFAASFRLPRLRRQLLVDMLMIKLNPDLAADLLDRRQAPRHNTGDRRMICRLPDGSSLIVKVLNRSVDGVSVDSPRKPPIGSSLLFGRTRGTILRHTPRGFVLLHDHDVDQHKEDSDRRTG